MNKAEIRSSVIFDLLNKHRRPCNITICLHKYHTIKAQKARVFLAESTFFDFFTEISTMKVANSGRMKEAYFDPYAIF